MSQTGLLNEDEIRNYFNENFNLKLDRDALLKPQRETLTDIYSRFLDDIIPRWRTKRRPHEIASETPPNFKAAMVGRLRTIISQYNIAHEFTVMDIIAPNRKKTVAFLNVLIFVRAMQEAKLVELQDLRSEREMEQAEIEASERNLSQRKLELEDLAIKWANTESLIEQLRNKVEKDRAHFATCKKQSESKEIEAKRAKESCQKAKEALDERVAKLDQTERELSEEEQIFAQLNEGKNLKSKISALQKSILEEQKPNDAEFKKVDDEIKYREKIVALCHLNAEKTAPQSKHLCELFKRVEREKFEEEAKLRLARASQGSRQANENKVSMVEADFRKQQLQRRVIEERAKADLEKRNADYKELERQSKTMISQIEVQKDQIEKERKTIEANIKMNADKFSRIIEAISKQTEMFEERYHELKSRDKSAKLAEINLKLEEVFFGIRQPPQQQTTARLDATYIKV